MLNRISETKQGKQNKENRTRKTEQGKQNREDRKHGQASVIL
jgi:hypothetical protein